MDSSSKNDLELGKEGGPYPEPSRCKNRLSSWVKAWVGPSTATKEASTAAPTQNNRQDTCTHYQSAIQMSCAALLTATVKNFPQGYPRFSALIASHRSFHLCRRFSALRTRLLLVKQDRLTVLEKRLEKLDRDEVAKLSLGTCRADKNEDRHAVLAEMDVALADYDAFLERHHRALSLSTAPARPVSTLWNWIDGTGCVARAETAYLEHGEDLVSLATPEDNIVTWLETLAEYASLYFHKQSVRETSTGPDVYIFPPSPIRRAVQIILAPLFTLLLLTPVIICNFVSGLTARLVIVILTTTGFIAALSCLTNIRPVDLIIAGATYTTVLVVFISGTDGGAS